MALQDYIDQINNIDINDIDWSRMGVWPAAAKIFVCLLLVGGVVAGTYFLTVKEKNLYHQSTVSKEEQLRKTFEKRAYEAANLEVYREQMAEMEKSFGAMIAQLPSDTEVPGLLEDIDEKGTESGLTINSITLMAERAAEFYIELPIEVKVSGTYHDLGGFVSGIAAMPRIVTLHDYQISKEKGDTDYLGMTIIAKTYRYKSQDK